MQWTRHRTRSLVRPLWSAPLLFALPKTDFLVTHSIFPCLLKWKIEGKNNKHVLERNGGYYKSGHIIWNLSNEPSASLINFIWNDHSCNILFIIWHLKKHFIAFKVDIISTKYALLSRMSPWRYLFPRKCYVTRVHNIIYDMTLSTEYDYS